MIEAFYRFADYAIKTGNRGINKKDMAGHAGILRSNSQYTNFHNLQYFGIIEHYGNNREIWYLSDKGEAFFYGEISLQSPVGVMANKALPDDHEAWATHKGKRKEIMIGSILPFEYKRRPEYQREKSPQSSLF